MNTIILDSTTKTIQVAMSSSAATTNPDFVANYADNTGSSFTEGANDGALNGTTPVTIVSAPGSATRRIIKNITIENKDTAAVTITVSYNNNGTLRTIAKVTLNVGDTWTTGGTFDTNGALKQTLGSVNVSSASGTLATTNGGTGLSTFSANQIFYASSTSAVGQSSNLTYDGSNFQIGSQGDLRFGDSDNSNWIAFQAPATVASNVTWTLPSTDGTNGQVLQTNGTGTLSWTTPSSGITTGKSIAMSMIFGF